MNDLSYADSARSLGKKIFNAVRTSERLRYTGQEKRMYQNVYIERTKQPTSMVELFGKLLGLEGWQEYMLQSKVLNNWDFIAGAALVDNLKLVSIRDKKLVLQPSTSVWATQAKLVAPNIIKKVNEFAEELLVDDYILVGDFSAHHPIFALDTVKTTRPKWYRGKFPK